MTRGTIKTFRTLQDGEHFFSCSYHHEFRDHKRKLRNYYEYFKIRMGTQTALVSSVIRLKSPIINGDIPVAVLHDLIFWNKEM
jgi:hypothetical protein